MSIDMKVKKGEILSNQYECSICVGNGVEHKIINVSGPATDRMSSWGPGLPTTKRKCTGCGYEDGPWVSADLVGGFW